MSIRCVRSVLGCTEPGACNFDPEANEEDGSCEYLSCAYCNVESACNYEPVGSFLNNASCVFPDYGYDCSGDCLPEFLVDGDCVVNTEDCSEASMTMAINPILGAGGIEVSHLIPVRLVRSTSLRIGSKMAFPILGIWGLLWSVQMGAYSGVMDGT